ncbi:MAG: fumarylacetoacetate hydrolase family protein [Verrucomicrobia bacterium]|nr:fumarylacetoacetate hydrolase family protein [Verrucomicrobiota bacterium]
MFLYRTSRGLLAGSEKTCFHLPDSDFDELVNRPSLYTYLSTVGSEAKPARFPLPEELLAPVGSQEVWAAGVTYERSREGRREEAKESGAAVFYTRVYDAERPELFFKAPGWRVVEPHGKIRVRRDARWSVPEPELVLVINRDAQILGYTLGNDVSSRDIEGENPLYLPQAKVYDGSCSLGPAILVTEHPLDLETMITLLIERGNQTIFQGEVPLRRIHRELDVLVEYLYRELSFPAGALLMTGTGIVPPNDFTLLPGDVVKISAAPIGELVNEVG